MKKLKVIEAGIATVLILAGVIVGMLLSLFTLYYNASELFKDIEPECEEYNHMNSLYEFGYCQGWTKSYYYTEEKVRKELDELVSDIEELKKARQNSN